MTRFHIKRDGTPGVCRAKKACPLGGEDKHYETRADAEVASQQILESKYPLARNAVEVQDIGQEIDNLVVRLHQPGVSISESDKIRTSISRLREYEEGGSSNNPAENAIMDVKVPDGGATFTLEGIRPTVGFCASPYPQHSKVFSNAYEVSFESLSEYVAEIESKDPTIFSQEETYLGLWNDPGDGKVYLDISKRYFSAEEARVACEENDQIAFFDLNLFESVDVDRNAKSGQK